MRTLNSEQLKECINRDAAAWFDFEMDRQKQINPERLEKTKREEPELIEQYREQCREDSAKRVADILDPEKFAARIVSGSLHPSNKRTRRLFTELTGIELPSTVSGTKAAIDASEYGPAVAACRQARQDERDQEDHERAEKEREKQSAEIARLEDCVRQNEEIDGTELLLLCRHHGIEVNPRSAGMWKSRIVSIIDDRCRMYCRKGQGRDATSAHVAYRELKSILFKQ